MSLIPDLEQYLECNSNVDCDTLLKILLSEQDCLSNETVCQLLKNAIKVDAEGNIYLEIPTRIRAPGFYSLGGFSVGNITYVPIDGDIQTYIDNANAGDTLILDSGVYNITDTITVDKQINIVGQGNSGFVTDPITASHGTLITSATGGITGFQIDNDNVRLFSFSIHLTGAASTGIDTANNLTGLVFNNIDIIVTCAGLARGFVINGSNIVMRNLTFYISSTTGSAAGIYFANDNLTTQNVIADCYSVTGTVIGAVGYAYGFACYNANVAQTLTLNLESSTVRALAGTALNVAVVSASAGTFNSIVNCYMCTLDGATWDAYQTGTNELNLGGSVIVNNKTSGTITYRAAMTAEIARVSEIKVGSDTDYSNFDADGVQTMTGDARVYKEIWVPFNALKAPGTNPAIFKEWGISGVWEFTDGTDDTIVFNIAIPLDMDRTVVPAIRIGWSTNTAVITETAVWQLEYLYRKIGEDTTAVAQATVTVNSNADAQANGFNIAAFPALALPDADDFCIHCRIKRLGADPADDLTDTAELHGVCFMYISDKLGEPL
jgi:hypothetical protein